MQIVYNPHEADKVQIGAFRHGNQPYTWEPVADMDGPDKRAVILFQPSLREALELLQGGSVKVLISGVRTPPKIGVEVSDLGRVTSEADTHAARVLYNAAGGHPIPWDEVGDEVRALYQERATALWRVFVAMVASDGSGA